MCSKNLYILRRFRVSASNVNLMGKGINLIDKTGDYVKLEIELITNTPIDLRRSFHVKAKPCNSSLRTINDCDQK